MLLNIERLRSRLRLSLRPRLSIRLTYFFMNFQRGAISLTYATERHLSFLNEIFRVREHVFSYFSKYQNSTFLTLVQLVHQHITQDKKINTQCYANFGAPSLFSYSVLYRCFCATSKFSSTKVSHRCLGDASIFQQSHIQISSICFSVEYCLVTLDICFKKQPPKFRNISILKRTPRRSPASVWTLACDSARLR